MSNHLDKISSVLGAASGIVDHPLATTEEKTAMVESQGKDLVEVRAKNRNEDYEFARKNIKDAIKQGAALVPTVVAVAREAENPKMFEAAAHFLKALSDLNQDLVGLSDEPKGTRAPAAPTAKSQEPTPPSAPAQVSQTNIYVGNDLLDAAMARQKKGGGAIDADFSEVDDRTTQ